MKKPRFVMSVRDALGLHSVKVHVLMTGLATYLMTINEAALPLLNALPPEMRAKMPYALGLIILIGGVAARMIAQPDHPASAASNGQ